MSTIRVGVVRGGPSDKYDLSLKSGAAALTALGHEKFAEKYTVRDILVDKDGIWYIAGVPVLPHKAFAYVDVFVNALHGAYGEDGKLQAILDEHGISYTGSQALASAVGINKILSKKVLAQHGIKIPRHIVVESANVSKRSLDSAIRDIFNTFSMPVVVKSVVSGTSAGVSIVKSFAEIEPAIRRRGSVIVEEYISGTEATVGVIDHFRNQKLYALPTIEIRHEHGLRKEIVPSHFSVEEKALLEQIARDIHATLGLRHYSSTDFIVSPRRGIYALGVDTLPSLAPASLLSQALAAVGSNLPDFLDHIIGLALAGK
jgi:D-alanine--D-alanine ligase